ncbi:MAG: complex I NDUFA9 subunit family protein [Gemmatimonadota bacterium]
MLTITGGTGFVGSRIALRALEGGRRVRVLARRPGEARELAAAGAELATADVLDRDSLQRGFEGADEVIHLVGIIVERGTSTFEAIHDRGTKHALEAARAAGVRRFVHMSALGARAGAASRYHASKWRGEEAVRASGLEWTIHRPSVVYGRGDGFLSRFVALIRRSPVVPIPGDGRNLLQPVWVEDVAACFVQSLERSGARERVFELGGPRAHTLNEIVEQVMRALGARRRTVHVPIPLLRLNAAALERLLPNPPVTRDQLLMLREDNVCDTTAMRDTFDVAMPELSEALRRVLA